MADPEMSLEEAGALLRQELNFHRAKLKLSGAVETALTARAQLKMLEQQKADVTRAIDDALTVKAQAVQDVTDTQTALTEAKAALAGVQKDRKALDAQIKDTRAAWADEQKTRDMTQAKALKDMDAAIAEKQAALTKLREELAAVVAGYQASAGSEA